MYTAWKLLFQASWKTFQTDISVLTANLQRTTRLIEGEATLRNIEQAERTRLITESEFLSMREEENRRRRIIVLSWLSAVSSDIDQEQRSRDGGEYPGTGQWLLADNRTKNWLSGNPTAHILWITGILGAGQPSICRNSFQVTFSYN